MKKMIISLACCVAFTAILQADFLRVEMGAGGWNQTPSGEITYREDLFVSGKYTTNGDVDTSGYLWVLLKQPIPLIPNVRLEYSSIDDKGESKGTFKDFDTGGFSRASSLNIKEYDIVPYYNLLDNTFWITLDLGIDLKVADTTYTVDGVKIRENILQDYKDSQTLMIPLVYVRARVEIPSTGIGIESDIKYITYDGSTAYDHRIKVDYTFDISPAVQPGIELGYRTQKFDLQSSDKKTKMNMDFQGVYAGVMLRF